MKNINKIAITLLSLSLSSMFSSFAMQNQVPEITSADHSLSDGEQEQISTNQSYRYNQRDETPLSYDRLDLLEASYRNRMTILQEALASPRICSKDVNDALVIAVENNTNDDHITAIERLLADPKINADGINNALLSATRLEQETVISLLKKWLTKTK